MADNQKKNWATRLGITSLAFTAGLAGGAAKDVLASTEPVKILDKTGQPVLLSLATKQETQDYLAGKLDKIIAAANRLTAYESIEFSREFQASFGRSTDFFETAARVKSDIAAGSYRETVGGLAQLENRLPKTESPELQEFIAEELAKPIRELSPVLDQLADAQAENRLFRMEKFPEVRER